MKKKVKQFIEKIGREVFIINIPLPVPHVVTIRVNSLGIQFSEEMLGYDSLVSGCYNILFLYNNLGKP